MPGHFLYTIVRRYDHYGELKSITVASRKINRVRRLKTHSLELQTSDIGRRDLFNTLVQLQDKDIEAYRVRFSHNPRYTYCFTEETFLDETKILLEEIKEAIAETTQIDKKITKTNIYYKPFMTKLINLIDKDGCVELYLQEVLI